MRNPSPDPYAVLGVPRTATTAEITHAYRTLLRTHHPDTRPNDPPPPGDPDAELQRVLAAYDTLRDPDRRVVYDRGHPASSRVRPAPILRSDDQPPIQAGPVHWSPR